MTHPIYIIGVADLCLNAIQQEALRRCSTLFAAERFFPLAPQGITCCPITPLKEALSNIEQAAAEGPVAVFASGDPLFFGIGRTLLRRFSGERLHFYPALSSIQRAAALFRLPWEDARLLSLHGRDGGHLPGLLLNHPKSLLLTDAANSPDVIATALLDCLQLIGMEGEAQQWQMQVAENLGEKNQRHVVGTLQQCANQQFAPLNVLCLQRLEPVAPADSALGLTEEEISHSRGLITKSEVRAATLHALRLPVSGVMWDVGAGSGSISIEAARSNPQLTIYAVEHKEEELANIKENIRRFRTFNVVPVFGRAPEALDGLPAPDRIFVGGSSGALPGIVERGKALLPQEGRLVINGVIARTVEAAPKLLREAGFAVHTSRLAVSRRSSDGQEQEFNPITITVGIKKKDEQ